MFFKMRSDIESNKAKISGLEASLDARFLDIKEDLKEQKEDAIRRHLATTVRHDAMDKKLDRLIERGISGRREHDS